MEITPIAMLTRFAPGDFHACYNHTAKARLVDA
jgi:hypothetical protein